MENSKLQFERENIEMSIPHFDSTPVGAKILTQKHQQWNLHNLRKKHKNTIYQSTLIQTQVFKTHHRMILTRLSTEIINTEDRIKRKSIGNARNRTL